jgi:hypothetical protein
MNNSENRPRAIVLPMSGSSIESQQNTSIETDWLYSLKRYLLIIFSLNLVWEMAHMPLYTLWETGTRGEILYAVVHCTAGDVLIASTVLMVTLLILGRGRWPHERFASVAVVTVLLGILYTIFSEWHNIEVRNSWAYRDAMPVIPVVGTGLSPLLQWIFVPITALIGCRGRKTVKPGSMH